MFDIELKHEGRKYEMDIKEDGTIVEIEKERRLQRCAPGHHQGSEEEIPTSRSRKLMEVNKVTGKEEKPIHYEVTIETDGKKKEVVVSLDGQDGQGGGRGEEGQIWNAEFALVPNTAIHLFTIPTRIVCKANLGKGGADEISKCKPVPACSSL